MPDEKKQMESLAKKNGIKVTILPRIGISATESEEPQILAYQMMGRDSNGNTCPFLDTVVAARRLDRHAETPD